MMNILIILLSLLNLSDLYAQEYVVVDDFERERSYDSLLWESYKIDNCELYDRENVDEDELRDKGLRRCRDGSISYIQPQSIGPGGWEGKCAQTFGANSLYSICELGVNPKQFFKKYFRDITPGVRPSTLVRGLNKIFKNYSTKCSLTNERKRWEKFTSKTEIEFLSRIRESFKSSPVGALILNPGGLYLHWVNIVNMKETHNSCELVINHWDNQYKVPCDVFAQWSQNVAKSYPLILKPYSLITYRSFL